MARDEIERRTLDYLSRTALLEDAEGIASFHAEPCWMGSSRNDRLTHHQSRDAIAAGFSQRWENADHDPLEQHQEVLDVFEGGDLAVAIVRFSAHDPNAADVEADRLVSISGKMSITWRYEADGVPRIVAIITAVDAPPGQSRN